MLGGFVSYYVTTFAHIDYFLSLVLAFLGIAMLGFLVELLFFAPVRSNHMAGFIISLGLLWVLQGLAAVIFGVQDKAVHTPISGVARLFGVVVSYERAFVLLSSTVLIVALYAFLRYSRHGLALRAVAQDRDAASLQGVDVERVGGLAFAIGCGLAGVAGALLAPVYFVGPFIGTLPVIKAFIIIILGGMGNLGGAVAGGFFLGLLESIAPIYLPISAVEILGFIAVMAVLVVRPQGLLGRA